MKNHIKYLLFTIVLSVSLVLSVSALSESDLVKTTNNGNTNISYSKLFESKDDARTSLKEFEDYMTKKNGKVLSSKIDNIIDTINTEILSNSIEVEDLNEIDTYILELQESYDLEATEERSCEVVLGDIETIETEEITYENESGVVGEYSSYPIARTVSRMVERYNNREDYAYDTDITSERRVVRTIINSIDETYNNPFAAYLRRLMIAGFGFDVSDVAINDRIVTDIDTEIVDFESVEDAKSYKENLENNGYRVEDELLSISSREEITDESDINEDFDSFNALEEYRSNLESNYNHVDVHANDNSYNEIINDTVSQDGFDSEDSANSYLDNLDYDLVYNRSVTSYTETNTNRESIVKYFTDENSAYTYLRGLSSQLQANESLENESVRKLSASEIDVNDILDKGEMNLSNNNRQFTLSRPIIFTTNVYFGNSIETGTVTINSVTVNGNSYTMNGLQTINNNSVASISGSIRYCTERGRFNICRNYTTEDFTSEGIINEDYNDALVGLLTFRYNIERAYSDGSGQMVVDDNLVPVYKLEVDKVTETEETYYKAQADVHSSIRRESYNLSGEVYNINTIPIMTVKFTKYSDRTVYDLIGDARLDIYNTFYIVNYNATRTIRTPKTTYKANYTVVETVNNTNYLASAEGVIEPIPVVANDVNVPNTGIKEYFDISLILVIVSALIASLTTQLAIKKNK